MNPALPAIALDHSGNDLVVAWRTAADQEPATASLPGGGRAAAATIVRLVETLTTHGCELREFCDWTVGTGPGGFTGLRTLAAFVAGITAGREGIRARGVPSALALAAAAARADDDEAALLYPGRDGGAFLYRARRVGAADWILVDSPVWIEPGGQTRFPVRVAMLEAHRLALSEWLQHASGKFAPQFFSAVPADWLLRLNPGDWRRDSLFAVEYPMPAAVAPGP